MKRLLLVNCFFLLAVVAMGQTMVRNIDELKTANKNAKSGDVIILKDGEWNNVTIALNCNGTASQPIRFRAETPGKVYITGHSQLKLGGNYIIVEGLSFERGYAGNDAVIDFRINKDQLANHCRVTNCVINDFNNPRRMDENNWISFSGKNNRLDHCSFLNKKNMGVLLAVILDDDRSRENFHSIDNNYFGPRPPLASNGGEIIRVGVSQHCQFNSNTVIADNYFEHCDGETEIISIKSGSNIVRNNIFQECQGGVVLRHGDNNTVIDNSFYGNGKEGTGGVRVINKGQWVVNNYFFQCRGVDFRSPLSVMNGVPNSPANRYVQVTDAVIANNTFRECAAASFCEGSDKERSMPPNNVFLLNNAFLNNKDSIIYKVYDDISGFRFGGNKVNKEVPQHTAAGFDKIMLEQKGGGFLLPGGVAITDSLQQAAQARIGRKLSAMPQAIKPFPYLNTDNCGASWHNKKKKTPPKVLLTVNCRTAQDVYNALAKNYPVTIRLTGKEYILDKPFVIAKPVMFTSDNKSQEKTISTDKMLSAFVIAGNGHLILKNIMINAGGVGAKHFISSDTAGSSAHYNLVINGCTVRGLSVDNICEDFFYAYKSMVVDSIVVRNSTFSNNYVNFLTMNAEKDDKGYYNAEKIVLDKNTFTSLTGTLLNIYRGGNDESTMGPNLSVNKNTFTNCTVANQPLIQLTGVQKTRFIRNTFTDCSNGGELIIYKDIVRADHLLQENIIRNSGKIQPNNFVKQFPKTE